MFHALADPTRMAVLAKPFDMVLPWFLQHLRLLEGFGLFRSRKDTR
ncbi:Hypothetical protein A7982_05802 [Minicystis rosea]|nr:Hypothetical protein A7982_05802 [Minicystis rosea]